MSIQKEIKLFVLLWRLFPFSLHEKNNGIIYLIKVQLINEQREFTNKTTIPPLK